jgi:FkbM family methyltransferase
VTAAAPAAAVASIAALDPVADLLRPARLTAVVDIGANPLNSDGAPPYKPLLDKGLCTVTGFEPQPEGHARLNAQKGPFETYLPYAIGDGAPATLKICAARGMSSLLSPDPRMLTVFPGFLDYGRVTAELPVETRTLDSIAEIKALDFLKVDVQGAELMVFRGGSARLAQAVAVQTEVSFMPLYRNQPLVGDIDLALRALGLVPHMFVNINKRMILPLHDQARPFAAMNQLLEADVVYVRDFSQAQSMSAEQLKHLALIAHHCYGSFDLATNCIHHLAQRGALAGDPVGQYLAAVKAG